MVIFASSRNMVKNSSSSTRCGRMRLSTTSFSKSSWPFLASRTCPMPPEAIFFNSW